MIINIYSQCVQSFNELFPGLLRTDIKDFQKYAEMNIFKKMC